MASHERDRTARRGCVAACKSSIDFRCILFLIRWCKHPIVLAFCPEEWRFFAITSNVFQPKEYVRFPNFYIFYFSESKHFLLRFWIPPSTFHHLYFVYFCIPRLITLRDLSLACKSLHRFYCFFSGSAVYYGSQENHMEKAGRIRGQCFHFCLFRARCSRSLLWAVLVYIIRCKGTFWKRRTLCYKGRVDIWKNCLYFHFLSRVFLSLRDRMRWKLSG